MEKRFDYLQNLLLAGLLQNILSYLFCGNMHRTVQNLDVANLDREIFFGWMPVWRCMRQTGP